MGFEGRTQKLCAERERAWGQEARLFLGHIESG